MKPRTKIMIVVVLAGVFALVISVVEGAPPDTGVLLSAGLITTGIYALYQAFNHYGWRLLPFSLLASSPNERGTWRFISQHVVDLGNASEEPPAIREGLDGGYLVTHQSDSHIRVKVLWNGDAPSELRDASPVSVNGDKLSFSGTYVELPAQTEHAFVAFLMSSERKPDSFVLRYRTDHGLTGELQAMDRRPWTSKKFDRAQKRHLAEAKTIDRFKAWWRPL
jgi:hypothetical protein